MLSTTSSEGVEATRLAWSGHARYLDGNRFYLSDFGSQLRTILHKGSKDKLNRGAKQDPVSQLILSCPRSPSSWGPPPGSRTRVQLANRTVRGTRGPAWRPRGLAPAPAAFRPCPGRLASTALPHSSVPEAPPQVRVHAPAEPCVSLSLWVFLSLNTHHTQSHAHARIGRRETPHTGVPCVRPNRLLATAST